MAWTERYVSVAGGGAHDGTSEANAWTMAEAIAGVASGQRVNVKAGTYANTTSSLTYGVAGTTTAPIWWRGYNSTIGDLDNDYATAKPSITFSTGRFIITSGFQIFSNLSILGTAQSTNAVVRPVTTTTIGPIYFDRCRIESSNTNANARAIGYGDATASNTNNKGVVFSRCWIKSTSSAPIFEDIGLAAGAIIAFIACALEGGSHGIVLPFNNIGLILGCAFHSVGGDAIRSSATNARIFDLFNTFDRCGNDGLEQTATLAVATGQVAQIIRVGSIVSRAGGYGLNNSSGTNTALIFSLFSDYYNNASGEENGVGDFPSLMKITEPSDPITSSTDLTPVSNASGIQVFPGLFENETFAGYADLGAVGRVNSGSSGGLIVRRGFDGGFP